MYDQTTLPILLLVDGLNLLWRSAYGFPRRIRSRGGTDVTAVFGFLALLRKAINELGAEVECIVCFDGEQGSANRRAIDPAYKQNRSGADYSHLGWLPTIKEALAVVGVTWMEVEQWEADDLIAALCGQVSGRSIVVMSTDHDFFQLVSSTTFVLNTAGRQGQRLIDRLHIVDRFRVEPWQWADYRALTGDPSDNIPGVRGIGPNRAAFFLRDGMTLQQLPDSGRLVGTWGGVIQSRWQDVLRWRELMRLRTDLDVELALTSRATAPLPNAVQLLDVLHLWD